MLTIFLLAVGAFLAVGGYATGWTHGYKHGNRDGFAAGHARCGTPWLRETAKPIDITDLRCPHGD